jgi:hypothetical protein
LVGRWGGLDLFVHRLLVRFRNRSATDSVSDGAVSDRPDGRATAERYDSVPDRERETSTVSVSN